MVVMFLLPALFSFHIFSSEYSLCLLSVIGRIGRPSLHDWPASSILIASSFFLLPPRISHRGAPDVADRIAFLIYHRFT